MKELLTLPVLALDPRVQVVILFGSRARGDARPDSDYDLLVFGSGGMGPVEAYRAVAPLAPEADVDVHLYSPQIDPGLAYDALRDARVLYERETGEGFFKLAELAAVSEEPPAPFEVYKEVARMGRKETLRRLESRLSRLERRVDKLNARMATVSEKAFLADEDLQESTFGRLYKITQDVFDISALILALKERIPPAGAVERIRALGDAGILLPELAGRLVDMAHFRNVMAHLYDELDLTRLYRFSSQDVSDVAAFVQAIKAYLLQQP